MKKLVSFVALLCMTVSLLSPGALAAGEGMADVLASVKKVIAIPAEYRDFSSNSYETVNGGKTELIWSFSWRSGNNSINASADSKGRLTSYSKYNYIQYSANRVIPAPKLSREEALVFAEAFLKKASPEIAASAVLIDSAGIDTYAGTYGYTFTREENGIPYYANSATVSIDYRTGEVLSFYSNWDYSLVFEAPGEVISPEKADGIFGSTLTAELIYATKGGYSKNDQKTEAVLVYILSGTGQAIDPATGEPLEGNYRWESSYSKEAAMGRGGYATADQAAITEEEAANMEELENLFSAETLDSALRRNGFLPIGDDYTLRYKNLGKRYDEGGYMWTLEYSGPAIKDDFNVPGAYATFDAATGELLSFYYYFYSQNEKKQIYSAQYAESTALEFLKKVAPYKVADTVLASEQSNFTVMDGRTDYYLYFQRTHGGIKYRDDYLSVNIDIETGKVTSFYRNWHSAVNFEDQSGVISQTDAVAAYVEATGATLQYQTFTTYYYDKAMEAAISSKAAVAPSVSPDYTNTTRLIYALESAGTTTVGAKSGRLLDYSLEPIAADYETGYSDASNHWSGRIASLLYGINVGFDGGKLLPDQNITQKDFVLLLSKVIERYYYYESSADEANSVYNNLISAGVVKESEKNPGGSVTKLQAVKFVIRAAGLEKAAEITGIYKTPFSDDASIALSDKGYCALASGLSIAKGDDDGRFKPQNLLTRAEALALIYNFMNA